MRRQPIEITRATYLIRSLVFCLTFGLIGCNGISYPPSHDAEDISTGQGEWRVNTEASVLPPAKMGNTVFVTSADGRVRAFDEAGESVWAGGSLTLDGFQPLAFIPSEGPVITKSGFIVISGEEKFYGQDDFDRGEWKKRGALFVLTEDLYPWQIYRFSENKLVVSGPVTPPDGGGALVSTTDSLYNFQLDGLGLEPEWSVPTSGQLNFGTNSFDKESHWLVGAKNNEVHGYDLEDGSKLWSSGITVPIQYKRFPVASRSEDLFFTINEGRLNAYYFNGNIVWSASLPFPSYGKSPIVGNWVNRIYYRTAGWRNNLGHFCVYDASSRTWRESNLEAVLYQPIMIANGFVYAGVDKKALWKFDGQLQTIQKLYESTGAELQDVPPQIDGSFHIWLADGDQVKKVAPNGGAVKSYQLSGEVIGLTKSKEDLIYALSENSIMLIDPRDDSNNKTFTFNQRTFRATTEPVIDRNQVLVGGIEYHPNDEGEWIETPAFYAVSTDKKLRWIFRPQEVDANVKRVTSPPAVQEDGSLLIPTDRRLFKVTPEGVQIQSFSLPVYRYYYPAIGTNGDIVVVASGKLSCFRSSGILRWEVPDKKVIGAPAIDGEGNVLFKTNSKFWAYDRNGILLREWRLDDRTEKDAISHVAIGPGNAAYFTKNKTLYRVNLEEQGPMAKYRSIDGPFITTPAIASDTTIYVGTDDGYLYAVTKDMNTTHFKFTFDGIEEWSAPLIHDGTVYAGNADGFLYAINSYQGAGLANSAWPMHRCNGQHTANPEVVLP